MIVYCAYCGPLSSVLLEKYPSGDDAWRIHLRSEEHLKAINEWATDLSDRSGAENRGSPL